MRKTFIRTVIFVILLATICFGILAGAIYQQRSFGELINIAGKQRMYSQKLAFLTLSYHNNLISSNIFMQGVLEAQLNQKKLHELYELYHIPYGTRSEEIHRYLEHVISYGNTHEQKDYEYVIGHVQSVLQSHEQSVFELTQRFEEHMHYLHFLMVVLAVCFFLFCWFLYMRVIKPSASMVLSSLNTTLQLNDTLEQRVQEEIHKRLENEKLLIQQSKMAAMGEMIGAIGHQWKQPLSGLSMTLQNLQDSYDYNELDTKTLMTYKEQMEKYIEFMTQTIDDFRQFFKADKEKVCFELSTAVDEIIRILTPQFKKYFINVNINMTKKQSTILGYRNEFKQVLLNILSNAKDAIIDKEIQGQINICVGETTNNVWLSIEDNGGGIPSEIMEKIFDPYFTTKPEDKGTGIGLYMSKEIIEKSMQGYLNVANTTQGAKFTVTLPKAPCEIDDKSVCSVCLKI